MAALPAYDGVTLVLGDVAVRLRPTLRAAHRLASPPDLFRLVIELHVGTIRETILTAATDPKEADAFLARMDATPLQTVADAVTFPLMMFAGALNPPAADESKASQTLAGPPPTWADAVRTMYRRATGWLGWTPEQAWNATPAEIDDAFLGWIEMQEALHPAPSEDGASKPRRPDPTDTTFDRDGLHALKGMRKMR